MALNGIEFTGYWDANANRVLGQAGVGLFDAPRQRPQLYKVEISGNTPLGGITRWSVGDFAYYTGYEWTQLLGPYGITLALQSILANLPTSPPPGGPGLWLNGGVVSFS